MKIKWQYQVTYIKVIKRAGIPSMEDLLIINNLRWTGHLFMMTLTVYRGRFSTRSYKKDNDHVTAHVSATKTQSR